MKTINKNDPPKYQGPSAVDEFLPMQERELERVPVDTGRSAATILSEQMAETTAAASAPSFIP